MVAGFCSPKTIRFLLNFESRRTKSAMPSSTFYEPPTNSDTIARWRTQPAASVALLAACGQRVEVPPAHVGKIMTKDGYQENLIPTSKFRLDQCWGYCDRLVVMDIADKAYAENLSIFIPEDQLNLGVTVQATLSINPKKTEELFKSISPKEETDQLSVIENQKIYQTYASQIIQKEVREYLSKFSISQIASSNEKINAELSARLSEIIGSRTPFNVRFVGITGLK